MGIGSSKGIFIEKQTVSSKCCYPTKYCTIIKQRQGYGIRRKRALKILKPLSETLISTEGEKSCLSSVSVAWNKTEHNVANT